MWLVDTVKKSKSKKKVTFRNIANEWLEIKKKEIKQSSYSNYRYSVNRYLMSEFEKYTLKSLERYNFTELIDELNQEYATKTVRDILTK